MTSRRPSLPSQERLLPWESGPFSVLPGQNSGPAMVPLSRGPHCTSLFLFWPSWLFPLHTWWKHPERPRKCCTLLGSQAARVFFLLPHTCWGLCHLVPGASTPHAAGVPAPHGITTHFHPESPGHVPTCPPAFSATSIPRAFPSDTFAFGPCAWGILRPVSTS